MSKIVLDELFSVKPTTHSWKLEKKWISGKNEETGEDIIGKDYWYCVSLSDALRRYANESIKVSENYKELMDKLEEVLQVIEKL